MRPRKRGRRCRPIGVVALSCVMAACLCSCKPTDFFTEVVITSDAETVDYDNPVQLMVNSPDAAEETGQLSALDWTDESPRSEETENLVTWSAEPNSELTTHHSVFALDARFIGIEASDGVRLSYSKEADIDHESEAADDDESNEDANSTSTGGSSASDADAKASDAGEETPSEDGESGGESGSSGKTDSEDGSGSEEGDGDGDGGGTDGDSPDASPGDGDGANDNPDGDGDSPSGGDGGSEVPVYDPGNAFDQVQHADSLAVIGADAAVMVQALGGEGAICAMSEDAYDGAEGDEEDTASSFSEVFADEAPEDSIDFFWANDGTDPDDISDIDAFVRACGTDGVIVYDQELGDQTDFFTEEQRTKIVAAGIQMVPVDMASVQGIKDAAEVIGEALSESAECAQDADAMASSYCDAVDAIVKAVAGTHGNSIASGESGGSTTLTTYSNLTSLNLGYQATSTFCYIATDSESGLGHEDSRVDASDVVLYRNNNNFDETPLYFWMQAAGVWSTDVEPSRAYDGLEILWPLGELQGSFIGTSALPNADGLTGGKAGGATSEWLSSTANPYTDEKAIDYLAYGGQRGLGSSYVPYLIVCASDGKSAEEVEDAVLESMGSYSSDGTITPYSVFRFANEYGTHTAKSGAIAESADESWTWHSTIGSKSVTGILLSAAGSEKDRSPFYDGTLSTDDVVRANPTGLLGSWTEGNMESVLESVWLADVYSQSPGGEYEPITDMSKFSVEIGGETCTTTEQAVRAFYRTFYRYEFGASNSDTELGYDDVVSDQGLDQ